MMEKFFIVGNWKMNGDLGSLLEVERICQGLQDSGALGEALEIAICPPTALLDLCARKAREGSKGLKIGAQDCHAEGSGAHTGDSSASLLAELGAELVICGHSERRAAHGEKDDQVKQKAEAAQAAGLLPIVCVGENLEQRQSKQTLKVLKRQIEASVPQSGSKAYLIAYEPIWAIGTGEAARSQDIEEAIDYIHSLLQNSSLQNSLPQTRKARPVLYGGSVNAENCAQIAALKGVGGLLIGNASLKGESFLSIIEACKRLY